MNKKEYLLTCLIEECAEVQKEATKALRFGLNDNWKERGPQALRIAYEFCDLISVYNALVKEGILEDVTTAEMIQMKQQRLNEFMGYARERGTLDSEE